MSKLSKADLVKLMNADNQLTVIDVNDDGITFTMNGSYKEFDSYMGFDVMWNDCEDCEGEGQVNL